ncbi:hypothetical protein L1049_013104 [Liquidambar formosana]|uniref:DUF4283 domain-containing protein n=1 Tax=Liquidambar formosana TaxID=63359 RepID=A0AAP0RNF7_LIQFO
MVNFSDDLSQLISDTANLTCYDDVLTLDSNTESNVLVQTLSLVGKLIATRTINPQATNSILMRAWNIHSGMATISLTPNTFRFGFTKEPDLRRAMDSGPWSIMGCHLVLKIWPPHMVLEEIDFSTSPFWVQIHGLPPDQQTHCNALKIGAMFDGVITVDPSSSDICVWSNFLRIKVQINVLMPLKTGFLLKRNARPDVWIHFKYERLSDFCYHCGRICHCVKACPHDPPPQISLPTNRKGSKVFGPWLRADAISFPRKSLINKACTPEDGMNMRNSASSLQVARES